MNKQIKRNVKLAKRTLKHSKITSGFYDGTICNVRIRGTNRRTNFLALVQPAKLRDTEKENVQLSFIPMPS